MPCPFFKTTKSCATFTSRREAWLADVRDRYSNSLHETAGSLARVRGSWLSRRWVDIPAIASAEERQLVQLFTLAGVKVSVTSRRTNVFTDLSIRLLGTAGTAANACREAYAGLDDDGPEGAACELVLTLFPVRLEPVTMARMVRTAGKRAALRRLLRIWHTQGVNLSDGVVELDEVRGWPLPAQVDLMHCLARTPAVDDARLRVAAGVILGDLAPEDRPLPLVAAFLLGVLMRGQSDISAPARQLLADRQSDEAGYAELARVAALDGDPCQLDALAALAEAMPAAGLPSLALWGRPAAVPIILQGLENARTAEAAAEAWFWLTAQRLPRRPRLHVVSRDQDSTSVSPPDDTIPDTDAAREWWAEHETHWNPNRRYVAGQAATRAALIELCRAWSGGAGEDLLDLLAVHLRRVHGVPCRGWHQQRLEALARLGAERDLPSE